MSKQKKTNVISLLTYRKKKQKLNLKKKSKAASDEDLFFSDHEEPFNSDFKDGKGIKEGKVYYMSNYWKTKHRIPLEEQSHSEKKQKDSLEKKPLQNSQKKHEKIINLSKYRKKNQSRSKTIKKQKKFFLGTSKIIPIEDYRKNKRLPPPKEKKRTAAWPFPQQTVKEALSFTAMALMMLFALNVFFPDNGFRNKQGGSLYVLKDNDGQGDSPLKREIAFDKASDNKKTKRGLSSFFKEKDSFSSARYIQKIQDEKFKDQKVIVGEKPDSSAYKGF